VLCVNADIVSHWTWAATLLQSSNQAYQYGVAGPFWYAGGATIQIILFGILAVQIKMKAPSAHTVLEIVHARWGNTAHLVFFFFCFLTNIIVSAMLILGGAAVMTALTGMNTIAVSSKPTCNFTWLMQEQHLAQVRISQSINQSINAISLPFFLKARLMATVPVLLTSAVYYTSQACHVYESRPQ